MLRLLRRARDVMWVGGCSRWGPHRARHATLSGSIYRTPVRCRGELLLRP